MKSCEGSYRRGTKTPASVRKISFPYTGSLNSSAIEEPLFGEPSPINCRTRSDRSLPSRTSSIYRTTNPPVECDMMSIGPSYAWRIRISPINCCKAAEISPGWTLPMPVKSKFQYGTDSSVRREISVFQTPGPLFQPWTRTAGQMRVFTLLFYVLIRKIL
jgi:hypothetical protein